MEIIIDNKKYNFFIKDTDIYDIFIERYYNHEGLDKNRCCEIWFYNPAIGGKAGYAYPIIDGKIYWKAHSHSHIIFPQGLRVYCDKLLNLLAYI